MHFYLTGGQKFVYFAISQPALSALLHEFETEIGVQLFTRTKSGVKPTENGAYILDSMKKIMHEVNYIKNYTAHAEELSGNFALMVGSSYEFLYAEFIQRFKTQFPKANLIPNNTFSPKVQDKVSKGLLDMAILAIYTEDKAILSPESLANYKNLVILPLKNCHTFALMNKAHKKSEQEKILFSQLISEQLIFGRQFEIDVFIKNLPLTKYPIFDIERTTALQLLKQNSAIFLDGTPLSLEHYQKIYPDYQAVPVLNDCISFISDIYFNWPVYLIYRKQQNSRLQNLYIEEVRQILEQYQLLKK